MDKLLIVCGPTSTGKTRLALSLASRFNGEIISADSRQVYKFLNIVTGKDIPKNFEFKDGCYTDGNIKIWGYDLVSPDEEFSASLYKHYAWGKIKEIAKRGKLPIIEGGTGFYIDAVLGSHDKMDVPRNSKLREKYSELSARELYAILLKTYPHMAVSLNESDRNNARRLIRKLEIADFEDKNNKEEKNIKNKKNDALWVGLNYKNRETLYENVNKRVDKRLGEKLNDEIDELKKKGYLKIAQSHTPGYKYYDDPEKWKAAERQYAKRQLTWFKRNKDIKWFDAEADNLTAKVEEFVEKWYSAK